MGLVNLTQLTEKGLTLLSIAAEESDAKTTVALIELGAEVERVDRINRTPLMYAARSKDPEVNSNATQMLEQIFKQEDKLGNTPLSWASGFGSAAGVQSTWLMQALMPTLLIQFLGTHHLFGLQDLVTRVQFRF